MNNTEQINKVQRFVVIDDTGHNYEVLDRFDTYLEAWKYRRTYPSDYVNCMTGGDEYDEDGHRIHIDETAVYDRAAELNDGLIIVYDKGDDDFEDLPDEWIMIDAIGVDEETRQQYEHCSDWIYRTIHELWLEELEAAYRADQ